MLDSLLQFLVFTGCMVLGAFSAKQLAQKNVKTPEPKETREFCIRFRNFYELESYRITFWEFTFNDTNIDLEYFMKKVVHRELGLRWSLKEWKSECIPYLRQATFWIKAERWS